MMYAMMPIPPVHATAMTNDVLWGMIGFLVVLSLVVTILWVVGSQRIARRQSQVKEAGRQDEASPELQYNEQAQVHAPEEERLLRR